MFDGTNIKYILNTVGYNTNIIKDQCRTLIIMSLPKTRHALVVRDLSYIYFVKNVHDRRLSRRSWSEFNNPTVNVT